MSSFRVKEWVGSSIKVAALLCNELSFINQKLKLVRNKKGCPL